VAGVAHDPLVVDGIEMLDGHNVGVPRCQSQCQVFISKGVLLNIPLA
jgi:hypothetical protein